MATIKTVPTPDSLSAFLDQLPDQARRADAEALIQLMQEAMQEPPILWGTSIIGFGKYHYRYASGHEGDSMIIGFAPRKDNFALYLSTGWEGRDEVLARLGKYKTAKGCLYVKRLTDVNRDVLKELITRSAQAKQAHVQEDTTAS